MWLSHFFIWYINQCVLCAPLETRIYWTAHQNIISQLHCGDIVDKITRNSCSSENMWRAQLAIISSLVVHICTNGLKCTMLKSGLCKVICCSDHYRCSLFMIDTLRNLPKLTGRWLRHSMFRLSEWFAAGDVLACALRQSLKIAAWLKDYINYAFFHLFKIRRTVRYVISFLHGI